MFVNTLFVCFTATSVPRRGFCTPQPCLDCLRNLTATFVVTEHQHIFTHIPLQFPVLSEIKVTNTFFFCINLENFDLYGSMGEKKKKKDKCSKAETVLRWHQRVERLSQSEEIAWDAISHWLSLSNRQSLDPYEIFIKRNGFVHVFPQGYQ